MTGLSGVISSGFSFSDVSEDHLTMESAESSPLTAVSLLTVYKEAKAASMDMHSFTQHHIKSVSLLIAECQATDVLQAFLTEAITDVPDSGELRAAQLDLHAMLGDASPAYVMAARSAAVALPGMHMFWLHYLLSLDSFLDRATPTVQQAVLASCMEDGHGATVASPALTPAQALLHIGRTALQQVFPVASSYVEIAEICLQCLLHAQRREPSTPSLCAEWMSTCLTFLDTYYPQWMDAYTGLVALWGDAVAAGSVKGEGLSACASSVAERAVRGRSGGSAPPSAIPLPVLVSTCIKCIRAAVVAKDLAAVRQIALSCLSTICTGSSTDVLTCTSVGSSLPSLTAAVHRAWRMAEVLLGQAQEVQEASVQCSKAGAAATVVQQSCEDAAKVAANDPSAVGAGGRKRKRGKVEPAPAQAASHSAEGDSAMDEGDAAVPARRTVTGLAGLLGTVSAAPTSSPAKAQEGTEAEGEHVESLTKEEGGTSGHESSSSYHPTAVYLQGLPFKTVTPEPVHAALLPFGPIQLVKVALTGEGRGKGWGIVQFETGEAKRAALKATEITVDGRTVHAMPCRKDILDRWLAEEVRAKEAATAKAGQQEAAAKKPVTIFMPHGMRKAAMAAPKARLDMSSHMSS